MAQKQTFDPGLTTQVGGKLSRAINRDGSFNVRRTGVPLRSRNVYLYMVGVRWPKFFLIVFLGFLLINVVFAWIYTQIPGGLVVFESGSHMPRYWVGFFFSVHTLTTVGYGSISPSGVAANMVAAVEAMVGLLGFALATGLLFSRFSRPSAKIIFSDRMVVAPYLDGTSLQFRMANQRDNVLMEVTVTVVMMQVEMKEGEPRRTFTELNLERKTVMFFPITWTVVHPIEPSSPMYGQSAADLEAKQVEFLVLVKAFDDTFGQSVNARFSYRHDEIVWNSKFVTAFEVAPDGALVLEMDRIHARRALGA